MPNNGLWRQIKKAMSRPSPLRKGRMPRPTDSKTDSQKGEEHEMRRGRFESSENPPTEEQLQVVHHPDGHHGRVLSVAGSGKTTTMAQRIKHLMKERGVRKHQIQVLMFNRLASDQFIEQLDELGISRGQQPFVNTFHSYAWRVANISGHMQWLEGFEWKIDLELRKSISTVARQQGLAEVDLSLEDSKRAISLWKGSLIPPDRAGHSGPNAEEYIAIYREFEKRRHENNAITYDDFVPLAVTLLGGDKDKLAKLAGPLRYIIVDEYQDINLGQQRLIELLASRDADVMVVGDDDQTIYEWRGARSEYILREFLSRFSNKPHITYNLSRSFRFGFSIAQAGNNVISHNTNRYAKDLLAHDPKIDSSITVVTPEASGGSASHSLKEEVVTLVNSAGVEPSKIKVLGRTFAQFNSLSTEFMIEMIPFKVDGNVPFFGSSEAQALLNYIRVAAILDEVPSNATEDSFLNIANKPSRYLSSADLKRMLRQGRSKNQSLGDLLYETTQDPTRFKRDSQRENLKELLSVLEEIGRKIHQDRSHLAGTLLDWIDHEVGLHEHYENFHGEGEASFVLSQHISALKSYAHYTALDWRRFIDHIDNFDTTQGQPENKWIRMTTIHRIKGLEFDYVVIPECKEGFMPVFAGNDDPTYDVKFPRSVPEAAEWIENERRLFYVGITRAKKGLFIGTSAIVSATQHEQNNSSQSDLTSSRFLEEWELGPTLEIAHELVLAARHKKGHRLVEKCRQYAAYHKIIKVVKEHYSLFFRNKVRWELVHLKLSNAERPFRYRRQYNSNTSNERGTEKDNDSDKRIWDWIPEQKRTLPRGPRRR